MAGPFVNTDLMLTVFGTIGAVGSLSAALAYLRARHDIARDHYHSADEAYTAMKLFQMQVEAERDRLNQRYGTLAASVESVKAATNGVLIVPRQPDEERSRRTERGKPVAMAADAADVLPPTGSWCEIGDHLVDDEKDMVWANGGVEYMCANCCTKHGFEVWLSPSTLAAQAAAQAGATASRGESPQSAEPPAERRGMVAEGISDDGSVWALVRTLGEAKELAQRYGVQTITKEGPNYRIDVPAHDQRVFDMDGNHDPSCECQTCVPNELSTKTRQQLLYMLEMQGIQVQPGCTRSQLIEVLKRSIAEPRTKSKPVEELQKLLGQVAEIAAREEDSMAALVPMFAIPPASISTSKINDGDIVRTSTDGAVDKGMTQDQLVEIARDDDTAPATRLKAALLWRSRHDSVTNPRMAQAMQQIIDTTTAAVHHNDCPYEHRVNAAGYIVQCGRPEPSRKERQQMANRPAVEHGAECVCNACADMLRASSAFGLDDWGSSTEVSW